MTINPTFVFSGIPIESTDGTISVLRTLPEMADARKDQLVGSDDVVRIGGHLRMHPDPLELTLDRMEVAHPVINDGDARTRRVLGVEAGRHVRRA